MKVAARRVDSIGMTAVALAERGSLPPGAEPEGMEGDQRSPLANTSMSY